jgi:Zn-dependent protease with chaperone function
MTRSYDAVVARLTEYAQRHPRGYRARVAGLALLGYAYLFIMLALLAGLVAALVFVILKNFGAYILFKAVIPFVVLIWMIGRSLWVKFTPPEGIELRAADAPRLMAEIEEVRTAMQAPRVHRVLVTDEFNAGVSQYPRLGIFGGYRVYLVIGLPLLGALPPEEFRAVLAHEFGHVSRAHGRFGAWIMRVRRTWFQLLGELDEKNHPAQGLFTRFFRVYAPYFEACTSVLSRAQEFEADEMAARISPGAVGPSLCRIEMAKRYLGRVFWPDVHAATRTSAEPPADVYRRLLADIPGAGAHASAGEWLAEELRQPTRTWDSHPATAERLAAVGVQPGPPPAFRTSAAQALLGPRADALADELGRAWQEDVREHWAHEHQQALQAAEQLSALEAKADSLTEAEEGERVWLTLQLHGAEVAVPMARALLDAGQEDASVHFLLGRSLAGEGDDAALPHLERAVALDHTYTPPACSIAAELLERLGRDEEAGAYHDRWSEYREMMTAAEQERSPAALTPKDVFLPHGLDAGQLAAVRGQLAAIPSIQRAYVVRKQVRHLPEEPLFIVGLVPARRFGGSRDRLADQVSQQVRLPGASLVLTLGGELKKFRAPLVGVPGSEVFDAAHRVAHAATA